ncbi:pyridoxal phosphate-dependent aminotransferase [Ferruginibacter paludis]|uniref:pyridoxal phosphate-dependent aminotransferase n=1 Tax=Ferruginibacter paludis TaxID=1310417 RepID=UPI0025B4753D|nr:pyridoxal phosphate-dependent aminotransferase [Ferruginibacter paludis]MDN3658632.1 pyridoxal phosphate-dependent aminotransferase [Ferruginibacter paludis]
MPSQKLSQLAETLIGSEIVKLGADIKAKMLQGEKIYNFTIGDFDSAIFPIPKELENEIVNAYRNLHTTYPPADGILELRTAVGSFIQNREGLQYNNNEILIAAGGRPLIYAAYRAIVDKGEKVIYAVPSWNNNHYVHFTEGQHIVIESKKENNFMPAAEEIKPHLKGASLLALCSPLNPTGTTFSKDELEAICDMVIEENTQRGADEKKLYLLYDQIYWTLTYGDTIHYNPVSLRPAMKEYTIFIDGISKAFAATGVRVGWALGPEVLINKMKAINSHLGAWAPMAEQNATAIYLLQTNEVDAYFNHFKSEIAERLQRIYEGFQQLKKEGFTVDAIAPQAAIYLTIQIDLVDKTTAAGKALTDQAEVTAYLLDEAKLAIVPFTAFGASAKSNWYRLSVGTCKKDEIDEMLKKLKAALQKLSK